MDPESLNREIAALRLQLKNLEEIDDTTRSQLSRLERRIEALLDEDDEEETIAEQVISSLEESAAGFAVKHPTAENLLRKIAYALGRMGI